MTGPEPEAREAEALEAVRRGDERGLEFLVARHELQARRIAFAITGNLATAEDVVAEAFLKVHQHIGRFEAGRRFSPWFLKIVTNEALYAARKTRRADRLHALLGRQPDRPADPVEVAEGNELRREVAAAVRGLEPRERAAITLRYLLDLDERSVAETLGWPLGTVKTRLHRARVRLREQLGSRLQDRPEVGAADVEHRG